MKYLIKNGVALTAMLAMVACSQDINPYDEAAKKINVEQKLQEFSFQTTRSVELNVNYGAEAAQSLINVYSENPMEGTTANNPAPTATPLFSAFLDANGEFSGKIEVPAASNQLYVYSPSWTAPQLLTASIENNKATVKAASNTAVKSAAAVRSVATRVASNPIIRKLTPSEVNPQNDNHNLYTINGGFNAYGKTNNENDLISEGELSNAVIASIQSKLWNGATTKPSGLDNSSLTLDNVNAQVLEQYVDENGVTQKVDYAEFDFTILTEAAWNESPIGYYVYKKGETPDVANMKKYIIMPNVSVPNQAPFGVRGNHIFEASNAPTHTNVKVKLLYEDENGNVSTKFPPNTEIGFFIITDAFRYGSDHKWVGSVEERTAGRINTGSQTLYSSKELNGGTKRFIAMTLADGTLVYGLEDSSMDGWGDKSYDDILFTVSGTPKKSISTASPIDEAHTVKPVEETFTTSEVAPMTYAYEDIWPSGGDYDINDAVVKHTRKITYNQFNMVSVVEDCFDISTDGSTSYQDAFAVQIDKDYRGTMTLPEGAIDETETGSIILCQDVRDAEKAGKTLVIRRELNGVSKTYIDAEDLNPFIINKTKSVSNTNRVEIHLPGKKQTKYCTAVPDGYVKYYVSKDGTFPYAIGVPYTWTPSPSAVRIDQTYPQFNGWASSKGQNNKDWYNYRNN